MDSQNLLLHEGHIAIDALGQTVNRQLRGRARMTRPLEFIVDFAGLASAFAIAYLLRFDFVLPDQHTLFRIALELPLVVSIQLWTLRVGGAHKFVWRYFSLAETQVFLIIATGSLALLVLVRFAVASALGDWFPPVSLLVVDTIVGFGGLVGLRTVCRILSENEDSKRDDEPIMQKQRILLIGAGRVGMVVARELHYRASAEYEIAGFVDDDPLKQGSVIQGAKVLGPIEVLPRLVRELNIDHVVITIASASRRDIFRIIKVCQGIPIKARIVPPIDEILLGKVEISRIRDVQVEDLLPREPVHFDEQGVMDFLHSRRVMVTGAGGSIGSELVRQVARYRPSELLLVERTEFALFNIDREMRNTHPEVFSIPLLADVGDEERMASIFRGHHPQVVIHAAAHKHVPMMEFNPTEAVKNNILATHTLGKMAGEFGVEAFVLISTDKAVRPTSVMGASKRMAELVVQHLNSHYVTRYVAVRFGNVLGSTGSVIPIFLEQIQKGGPVTVTHPEMVRYFMTISEAAQLVLEACTIGKGGEVFVLDMGEPVLILELAERLIALSGLKRRRDIDIVFTGMRPGEKLIEETAHTEEHLAKTVHPKIFIGDIATYGQESLQRALERLALLAKAGDESGLRILLNGALPEAHLQIDGMYPAEIKGLRETPVAALPDERPGSAPEQVLGTKGRAAGFGLLPIARQHLTEETDSAA